MGIQHLNMFMRENATPESIKKIQLASLKDKIIAVDISIYLYRFMGEGALLENIYNMLSVFRYHKIFPIFVFDGKSPIEKTQLLQKRSNDKHKAEERYKILENELKKPNSYDKIYEISKSMIHLKKKFIRLKKSDIKKVKELIVAFGASYLDAEGEADALCAKLVVKKKAYACLSEDMDLFVYGCPRVLRYFSLLNETVVIYYLNKIISDLKMTFNEFKEICIISGTDYNIGTNNTNLNTTIKYFYKFKENNSKDFYEWLIDETNYIKNIYELFNTFNLFTLNNILLKNYKYETKYSSVDRNRIREIMIPEGFIFYDYNN